MFVQNYPSKRCCGRQGDCACQDEPLAIPTINWEEESKRNSSSSQEAIHEVSNSDESPLPLPGANYPLIQGN